MSTIKSHKTVEQIAKKHRLDVLFVKNQLKMGIPIEHEHTKDEDLATDIALQHLDEIPDYYIRLKKMEASAKKSHNKKYKDVTEERRGLWANIHAKRKRGERPAKPGEKGYPETLDIKEGIKQARKNVGASKCWTGKKLGNPPTKMKGDKEVPNCVGINKEDMEWNDIPIPITHNDKRYCPGCKKEETRSECKYGKNYWDTFSLPIIFGKDYDPNSPHPGNMPESKDHEYSMARSEISTIISAANRLKKKMKGEGDIEAWVQSKITKAADYLDTAADYVDSGEMKSEQMLPPIDPERHKRAQKIQKLYNKGYSTDNPNEKEIFLKKSGPQLPLAKGEGGSPGQPYNPPKGPSQPTQPLGGFDKFRDKYGIPKKPSLQMAHYVPENDIVDEQVAGTDTPADEKDIERFSTAVKAIGKRSPKLTDAQKIGALKQAAQIYRGFRENVTIQDAEGNDFVEIIDIIKPEKMKGLSENSKTFNQFMEDWQKVNRKDKTDGLSQAAVDAYRRENPGSKLQTAVTEKKPTGKRAKRRSNFCRRMKGMKSKLTSAKTARDPDSRINKALRRWNCH